jgi:hypothetical protein
MERGSRATIALAKQIHKLGGSTVIPASALAQVWRAGPKSARLARLVSGSDVDALGESRAKEIGVRLGTRGTADITDAHVVCCAVEYQAPIATSDQNDLAALLDAGEPVRLLAV